MLSVVAKIFLTDSLIEGHFSRSLVAGAVTHYALPMDIMLGTTLINPSGLDASAVGAPALVEGVAGKAVQLNTPRQYVKVSGPGHRLECFGDLDLCNLGECLGSTAGSIIMDKPEVGFWCTQISGRVYTV